MIKYSKLKYQKPLQQLFSQKSNKTKKKPNLTISVDRGRYVQSFHVNVWVQIPRRMRCLAIHSTLFNRLRTRKPSHCAFAVCDRSHHRTTPRRRQHIYVCITHKEITCNKLFIFKNYPRCLMYTTYELDLLL